MGRDVLCDPSPILLRPCAGVVYGLDGESGARLLDRVVGCGVEDRLGCSRSNESENEISGDLEGRGGRGDGFSEVERIGG